MDKVVAVFVAVLAFAVLFVAVTADREMAALFEAFRSQSQLLQAAWTAIVFVPFALLVCAVWLVFMLMRQRRSGEALELRLNGVRKRVKDMIKSQADAEAEVRHLARTDPEDAMSAIQQRLTEAERVVEVQRSRNEATDLESRVDYLRAQQHALKERLAPLLERRRTIEQIFMELDGRQNDLDRTLNEIASGDDAVAIDMSLKKMMEFVARSHGRCDDFDRTAKIMAALKQDYVELAQRISPFAAAEGGVASKLRELHEKREQLAADLDSLLQTPEGTLAARAQKFADDRKMLGQRLAEIEESFLRLSTLGKEIADLFVGFGRALDILAIETRGEGEAAVDARVNELTRFILATQAHLDDIDRRLLTFGQLRTKLGDLQTRLAPLDAEDSGIIGLIEEVREVRDMLTAKIRRLEESEDGSLADRVKKFGETRPELEERVSTLTDQFIKLATIREDIAGLFDKLSAAVSASAG